MELGPSGFKHSVLLLCKQQEWQSGSKVRWHVIRDGEKTEKEKTVPVKMAACMKKRLPAWQARKGLTEGHQAISAFGKEQGWSQSFSSGH